jgi:hypothetical protein
MNFIKTAAICAAILMHLMTVKWTEISFAINMLNKDNLKQIKSFKNLIFF